MDILWSIDSFVFSFCLVLFCPSVKAGLWKGNLELRQLQVRTDVLRKLHLPIMLKQGSVDYVRIQASLTSPIVVHGLLILQYGRPGKKKRMPGVNLFFGYFFCVPF